MTAKMMRHDWFKRFVLVSGFWAVVAQAIGAGGQPSAANAVGPIEGVREILFVVRGTGPDPHWYANFGRYAPERLRGIDTYPSGSSLRVLDLETGAVRSLLEDPEGGIRDPQVHYDGGRILFSYRPGGRAHYHLYEIRADGGGLRQLTDGPWDDIEPTWLPDGDIVFVSSRCQRWVNCWLTPVATLHRCGPGGENIQPISANIEHDNTPWPLADGRILYTRWEYVDRSQVHYHHLWAANRDGTGQMPWFGNLHPGILMIDAKPVPESRLAVAVFSPGHGRKEHAGWLALVDPEAGPDRQESVRRLTKGEDYRDPWALSEACIIAARGPRLVVCDGQENERPLFRLPPAEVKAGQWCHEPRPLAPRPREPVITPRTNPAEANGRMFLMDVRLGRNMAGVEPGEIRKLLVLESLPKPINYTGGMEPLSYGGTFTLERVLGTVPVEADGSAYFELPARRSVLFVALDQNDKAVKRMQSFTSVEPGEVLGCVGCHEHRTVAPPLGSRGSSGPLAGQRKASPIEPIDGVPDLLDFPRDIQPILDRHCVECHRTDRAEGGVILTGDHGPIYSHSYFSLTVTNQLADGRNRPQSNYPPRALGSGAAPLLGMLEGGHHQVTTNPAEQRTVRLWLDTGAPYPGTYAALGSGMIGGYERNEQVIQNDRDWPETVAAAAVIIRRCGSCHQQKKRPIPRTLSDEIGFSFWMPDLKDQRIRRNRHIVFNLSRPEKSLMLCAPLAKAAGGHGTCRPEATPDGSGAVFTDTANPDYQAVLAMVRAGKRRLDEVKRFDMPGFRPRPEWLREMQTYGVLPAGIDPARDPIDVYQVERAYWSLLQHHPDSGDTP
ncbi:MAG: hypothetical protein ACC645_12425 [Pirellulales bacterium]